MHYREGRREDEEMSSQQVLDLVGMVSVYLDKVTEGEDYSKFEHNIATIPRSASLVPCIFLGEITA